MLKETYSIPQFMKMQRDKELLMSLGVTEGVAFEIRCNKKMKILFTLGLALILHYQEALAKPAAKTVEALNKVDTAGATLLAIVRKIGYWICIIMCIIEILRCLGNGNTKEIGKVIVKYLIAFGACYLLPFLFDLIAAIFG
jgi:hypothetical protein